MVVASAASDLAAAENFSGEEMARLMVRAQIQSVISRVLRNQIDFLHAVGDERLRFRTMSLCVRLRCEPRIRGMMQKLHG